MPFSPEDIERKEFLVALRGFDKDEVSTFLRAVAADYRELKEAADAASALPTDTFTDVGGQVAGVLRAAAEAANEIKEQAERDARQIRAEAEDHARDIIAQAHREAESAVERKAFAEREAEAIRAAAVQEAAHAAREAAAAAGDVRAIAARDAEAISAAAAEERERILAQARVDAEQVVSQARLKYEELRETELEMGARLQAAEALLRDMRTELASDELLTALDHAAEPEPDEGAAAS